MFLASLHASPRAHRSCLSAMDLCLLGCLLDAAKLLWIVLVEFVPKLLCPSVESLQFPAARRPAIHNRCTSQTIASALLSPPFFGLSFGCSSTYQCGNEHSVPNLHPDPDFWNWHSGGCQYSQCDLVQVPFKNCLHGCRLVFPDWHLPLKLLFLDALLPLGVGGSEGGAVFGVGFARSLPSCRKLHSSPLEHCSFAFHWQQTLFPLSIPLNPLRLVITAPVSILSLLASNFVIEVSDLCFFSPSSSIF